MSGERTETGEGLATDLGGQLRAGKSAGAVDRTFGAGRIDVTDADQVFDLALELCTAPKRRLMQVNLPELRALAVMVVRCAPTMSRAIELVRLSDGGQARPDCEEALKKLVAVTRQNMEGT